MRKKHGLTFKGAHHLDFRCRHLARSHQSAARSCDTVLSDFREFVFDLPQARAIRTIEERQDQAFLPAAFLLEDQPNVVAAAGDLSEDVFEEGIVFFDARDALDSHLFCDGRKIGRLDAQFLAVVARSQRNNGEDDDGDDVGVLFHNTLYLSETYFRPKTNYHEKDIKPLIDNRHTSSIIICY